MNFDDTARFFGPTEKLGNRSTLGEHICPQCVLNGRSHWTKNKIFCDLCISIRESFGFWSEPEKNEISKKKCRTSGCRRLVEGRVRYCSRCIATRRREQYRKSKQASRCPISRNLARWG